jgi:hypothetical protein
MHVIIPSIFLCSGLANLEMEDNKDGELTKLHPFEVAQLANLMLEDGKVEEALAWLPSLDRFEEASLQQALDVVSRARSSMSMR